MMFQDANLLPWRNLRQNIEFRSRSSTGSATRARRDAAREIGLTGFDSSYPRELSGGMQQRASIVRALAPDPAVLLMDEPFGALDAFTRDEMNLLLMRLWSETCKTIVFVTHNIGEAIFLADRVVVMTPRPGRLARIFDIDLPRPRTVAMTFEPDFIELIQEIKSAVEHRRPDHRWRWNEMPCIDRAGHVHRRRRPRQLQGSSRSRVCCRRFGISGLA